MCLCSSLLDPKDIEHQVQVKFSGSRNLDKPILSMNLSNYSQGKALVNISATISQIEIYSTTIAFLFTISELYFRCLCTCLVCQRYSRLWGSALAPLLSPNRRTCSLNNVSMPFRKDAIYMSSLVISVSMRYSGSVELTMTVYYFWDVQDTAH